MKIRSDDPRRTVEWGYRLGGLVRSGDVVVLEGELGAGKTTFTQGLGRALGIEEPVTSPTFVVAREHTGRGVDLLHVDAYRIHSVHEWDDLDLDIEHPVAVIEWGDRVSAGLPADRLTVRFEVDDDSRSLEFSASGPRSAQLLESLEAPE